MRKIKFRAWDEEAEKMFYSADTEESYFFAFKDGTLRGFAIRDPVPSSDPMEPPEPYCDDYPVMQSTGLFDKKRTKEYPEGQEIFEGDIIKIPTGYKFEVKMEHFLTGYHCGPKSNLRGYYGYNYYADGEVIDSIHENPELTERKE